MPTTPSLDAFPDLDCSLLSESLSLDTISTVSLDPIPPFPYGCMVPLSTFLTASDSPCNQLGTLPAITTTIPTPPRLRTLLKEDLCISKWTETLVAADAPGHTPWGEVEDNEITAWKPEGSLYPSDFFQEALSKSRQRAHYSSPLRHFSTGVNAHHREALVFEREITLPSEDGTKRWSVQVPAGSMTPDLVDMMVELRNLNTYFKEEVKEVHPGQEEKVKTLMTPDNTCAHPPSLIVSDSQCVIPLSLESTGSLHAIPKTLAARRGNKSLAPLALKPEGLDPNSYPSIPTAFLGSPSSYCPTFEFIGSAGTSPAFHDMIDSLRSQCVSLQVNAPCCPALPEEDVPVSQSQPDDDSINEWAFADSLLEKYPDFCIDQHWENCNANVLGLQSQEIIPEANPVNDISSQTQPFSPNDPSSASPSPSIASSASPTLSPRGILKRCKSVRFAENPLVEVPDEITSNQAIPVRHSIGSPAPRALKRPSPLRHTYALQSNIVSTQSPLRLDSPTPSLRAAGRQKPSGSTNAPSSRATDSVTKSAILPLQRAATMKVKLAPPQKKESIVSSPVQQKEKTQDRPSLGRSFRNTLVSGKENKKVKAPFSSNRHTMDENALRRTPSGNTETQKSRMPVPLRNIFTRFK